MSTEVEWLSLRLLGGFRVDTSTGVLDVPASAQRLVAYLALQDRPVTRRQLAGVLWPETDEERSAANLRSTLWRAHRSGARITANRELMWLDPEVEVDVQVVARYAADLTDSGRGPPGIPSGLRFDHDLLPGWYEDWVVEEREHVRQLMLRSLALLVPALISDGRVADGVELAQQAVRLEPLCETSHRTLIAAYLAAGDRARALRQFHDHADLLRTELGLDPSDGTIDLVRHLLPVDATYR
jgi:DNA-binding SARP family transcriptional activator